MMSVSSANHHHDGGGGGGPPVVPPSSFKPTSRARTYRIPNTSDAAAAAAAVAGNDGGGGVGSPSGAHPAAPAPESSSSSSLWATREIAALDFLMNVPLRSERDIVRAGLSGGRWHRQRSRRHEDAAADDERNAEGVLNFSSGVEHQPTDEDGNKVGWGGALTPHAGRAPSVLDVARASGADEEATTATGTGTESSMHAVSLLGGGENNKYQQACGRWWDKLILKDKRFFSAANQQARRMEQLELEERELERPTESPSLAMTASSAAADGGGGGPRISNAQNRGSSAATPSSAGGAGGVPGRRLDGREAVAVAIPGEFRRRPPPARSVARQAAVREWEIRLAYGARGDAGEQQGHRDAKPGNDPDEAVAAARNCALLDGRVFFSTRRSYPVAVFSTIKYEPRKEEALRRRRQLEELGGGGTQFVLPERDWRGISYRSLLPRQTEEERNGGAFNRLLLGGGGGKSPSPPEKRPKKMATTSPRDVDRDRFAGAATSSGEEDGDGDDDSSASSSGESEHRNRGAPYFPGFLDDPQMVQGRNRNVMMGDKVTGPVISSTIQFVKPSVLKADLNKQFRERFDRWEPPKGQRKYIGARVIDGVYTLIDPTETMREDDDDGVDGSGGGARLRSGSVTAERERETIRMPPSLTLSKIRSLKQQALVACVRARIEISTLALACIYFERLCLDCRVDKSNRRLSFAACLLLAAKVNESNSMIAYERGAAAEATTPRGGVPMMNSWVKPNRKSGKIFESLVVFFTHDWSLSLKQLYAAEWIVFTALGFSLKAKPSEVAFHFKRLLRVLEWNPRSYLGPEMYRQWQESLMEESRQNERHKVRREARIKRNERRLLKLQRQLHLQQQTEDGSSHSISRRSSATISEAGVSRFRRHSADSPAVSVGAANSTFASRDDLDSPGRLLRTPKKAEGVAKRGLLSRLARPKPVSQGKELNRLPKLEKKGTAHNMKHSASVPNLASFDSKTTAAFVIDIDIHEGDNESCHSDHPKRESDGIFL